MYAPVLPTAHSSPIANATIRAGFRAGQTGQMPSGPHQKGPPPNGAPLPPLPGKKRSSLKISRTGAPTILHPALATMLLKSGLVNYSLHLYNRSGVFYFPWAWHRQQVEGTYDFYSVLSDKTRASCGSDLRMNTA